MSSEIDNINAAVLRQIASEYDFEAEMRKQQAELDEKLWDAFKNGIMPRLIEVACKGAFNAFISEAKSDLIGEDDRCTYYALYLHPNPDMLLYEYISDVESGITTSKYVKEKLQELGFKVVSGDNSTLSISWE